MSNLTYVRWQKDEPRRQREFPPLEHGHPSYDAECVLCPYPLGYNTGGVQLVAVGPDDPENKAKHDAGKWYSAAAVVVHTSCLALLTDEGLEEFVGTLVKEATVEEVTE